MILTVKRTIKMLYNPLDVLSTIPRHPSTDIGFFVVFINSIIFSLMGLLITVAVSASMMVAVAIAVSLFIMFLFLQMMGWFVLSAISWAGLKFCGYRPPFGHVLAIVGCALTPFLLLNLLLFGFFLTIMITFGFTYFHFSLKSIFSLLRTRGFSVMIPLVNTIGVLWMEVLITLGLTRYEDIRTSLLVPYNAIITLTLVTFCMLPIVL
ncbi:MAG: YIP1 family protein [Candidatus Baldrarchaeia archaeon]